MPFLPIFVCLKFIYLFCVFVYIEGPYVTIEEVKVLIIHGKTSLRDSDSIEVFLFKII